MLRRSDGLHLQDRLQVNLSGQVWHRLLRTKRLVEPCPQYVQSTQQFEALVRGLAYDATNHVREPGSSSSGSVNL